MKRHRRCYSHERKENVITFWSDDTDLVDAVDDYISMLIDADRYRSQIDKVTLIEEDDTYDE